MLNLDEIYSRIHPKIGWFNRGQAETLLPYIEALNKEDLLVEIGTFHGKSTYFFALVNPDINILTIDLVKFPEAPQNKGVKIDYDILLRGHIFQVLGNNNDVSKGFNWKINFLFIDGDHSKAQVAKDIIAWQDKLIVGGYIAFHDYEPTHQGVIDATTEWLENNKNFVIDKQENDLLIVKKVSNYANTV